MQRTIELGELFDGVYNDQETYECFIAMTYASAMRNRNNDGTPEWITKFIGILEGRLRWFVTKDEETLKYRQHTVNLMETGLEETDKASTTINVFKHIPNKGPDDDACRRWVISNFEVSKRLRDAMLKVLGTVSGTGCKYTFRSGRNAGMVCSSLPVNEDGYCESCSMKPDVISALASTKEATPKAQPPPKDKKYRLIVRAYKNGLYHETDHGFLLRMTPGPIIAIGKLVDNKEVPLTEEDISIALSMGLSVEK